MKRVLILSLLLTVVLCSCQNYKKLSVESYSIDQVESFAMEKGKMASKMVIKVVVNNPTSSKYTIKKLDAVLYTGNQKRFAEISALENAVITPNSNGEVPVLMNVTLLNALSALSAGLISKDSLNLDDMTVDIDMIIHSGIFCKRIKEAGIPVDQLLNQIQK